MALTNGFHLRLIPGILKLLRNIGTSQDLEADIRFLEHWITRLRVAHLDDMITDDALTSLNDAAPLLLRGSYALQTTVVRLIGRLILKFVELDKSERTRFYITTCGRLLLDALRNMQPVVDSADNAARSVMATLLRDGLLPKDRPAHLAAAAVFVLNGPCSLTRSEYETTLEHITKGSNELWWCGCREISLWEEGHISEMVNQGFMNLENKAYAGAGDKRKASEEEAAGAGGGGGANAPVPMPVLVDVPAAIIDAAPAPATPATHAAKRQCLSDDLIEIIREDIACRHVHNVMKRHKFVLTAEQQHDLDHAAIDLLRGHGHSLLKAYVNQHWGVETCARGDGVRCGFAAQVPCSTCARRSLAMWLFKTLRLDEVFARA